MTINSLCFTILTFREEFQVLTKYIGIDWYKFSIKCRFSIGKTFVVVAINLLELLYFVTSLRYPARITRKTINPKPKE